MARAKLRTLTVVAVAVAVLVPNGAQAETTFERTAPSTPPIFETHHYGPLDLARAARDQYGSSATVVAVGEHLYSWRAKVGRAYYSLDLKKAVRTQYGSSHSLVAVGPRKDDWKAVRLDALPKMVLPVMLVASDVWFDITRVSDGLARYRSVLTATANWYGERQGTRFRMLAPVIVPSQRTGPAWNDLSILTTDDAHRYDMAYAARSEYRDHLPAPGSNLRVHLVPFTGRTDAPSYWYGAAAVDGRYAVAAPDVAALSCPATGPLSYGCGRAAYAVGHELGHTFGLDHTCDDYGSDPSCTSSIMETAYPWNAVLLAGERGYLASTGFFG